MNTYQLSNGERIKKTVIDARVKKAKAQVLENQLLEYGYNFCVNCKRSTGVYLDCSHIVSVKDCQEMGKSELAYDVDNIEVLCRFHHQIKDNLDIRYGIS